MLSVVDESKAYATVEKYFNQLKNTGYVKRGTSLRLLMYLFLVDFVDQTFWYLEEEDYNLISKFLRKLFTGGGCLLPYPVCCANRVTLGKDGQPLRAHLRITEDASGNEDRITEDNELRAVAE